MITKTFRKHGHTFQLLKVGIKHLIYERKDKKGTIIGYELHKLYNRKQRTINGITYEPTNRLPSDEDFGKKAWSFIILNSAIARFRFLENRVRRNLD